MADITMPQLGETVTEGTVTRWLKKVGESVAQDEVLFEVSTDKVDSEVPSAASGFLSEILVPEGETVEVGTRLAVISQDPADVSAAPAPQAAPTSELSAAEVPAAEVPAPAAAETPAPQAPAPVLAQEAPAAPQAQAPGGPPQVLSPVVRKLLAEHQIDVNQVAATGAGGRVTRADVLKRVDELRRSGQTSSTNASVSSGTQATSMPSGSTPPPASHSAPGGNGSADHAVQASPGFQGRPQQARERDDVLPFNNIRRRTAEHMVRSKATSAHTLVAMEVDFENVEGVRKQFKDRFRKEEGTSLTYLPFVARALVEAVREYPHVNSSIGDDSLIIHRDLHLGIAVDLQSEGLIVPVIHNVDGKRIRAIARELADLATRARNRRLSADDISGGTFTITNPGPFGTFLTVPIINQPQVAILSTDGVRRRPVVVTTRGGEEALAIHSVGMLALSFDHRAIDGAYAARFMARIQQVIQEWDWSQEL